jgi:NADPH2:quinone reductase
VIEVDIAANAGAHLPALANHGDWVVYGSGAPNFTLPFFPMISKNVSLRCFIVYHLDAADRRRAEDTLRAWLDRGALQHRIAARLPLVRVAEAHRLVETGAAVGNVLVEIP